MAMIARVIRRGLIAAVAVGLMSGVAMAQTPTPNPRPDSRVTIYPLLVEATLFGASADVPDDPNGGGGGASGATSISLNAAYMGGLQLQFPRWFADMNGTWAAVSASRETPFARIDSRVWLINARAGVRLTGRLFLTGGVRRVVADLDAQLTAKATNTIVPVQTKPGFWDPLVGVDWRGRAGSFDVVVSLQGGGFGVGTDIDLSADMHADWHAARYFAVRFGYQTVYYKWTIDDATVSGQPRQLTSSQSLHGPSVGIAITF